MAAAGYLVLASRLGDLESTEALPRPSLVDVAYQAFAHTLGVPRAQGRTLILLWLLLCGAALGLAFLVKTLQAWLIVPPLAIVYLVCAQPSLPRRIGRLLLAGLAMVASCGWWVALVELWPASSRPYVGGSQNNNFLELTLGYNGLGRITGNEVGSVGPDQRDAGDGGNHAGDAARSAYRHGPLLAGHCRLLCGSGLDPIKLARDESATAATDCSPMNAACSTVVT